MMNRFLIAFVLAVLALGTFSAPLRAQDTAAAPAPVESSAPAAKNAIEDLSSPIKIVLLLTALALLPAILMTVTTFTRIVIVLSFVRRALAVQELPPNQVVIGLSIFLTVLSMNPILSGVYKEAVQPYVDQKITLGDAGKITADKMHTFLGQHAQEEEIQLFLELSNAEQPERPEDVPLTVLVPAFALSELKIAFKMGFLVYIPFLIVDIVVASILLAMGMFMLPPVIISTPLKILLFIMVDGWALVIRSLMQSFEVAA